MQQVSLKKEHIKDVFDSLESFLDMKRSEFKKSYTTFIPNFVVECDTVSLNFVGRQTVVSVRESKDQVWNQFVIDNDGDDHDVKSELQQLIQSNE